MRAAEAAVEAGTKSAAGAYTFINGVVEPWHSPWLTHQPLMSAMGAPHRVLYVLPEENADAVLRDLARRPWAALRGSAGERSLPRRLSPSGLERIGERLYQLRTRKLYPKFYISRRLNEASTRLRAREIRRVLDGLGWDNRIFYVWNPRFADLMGRLGEKLTVLHCHDYYPAFCPEGPARAEASSRFRAAVEKADLVFAAGESILREVRAVRAGGVLVENGVDFRRFRRAAGAETPGELADLPRPLIGYVGRLNRKVDIPLMAELARARPEWSFLLMGPVAGWNSACEAAFQDFIRLPNTRCLPGKDPADLPFYMNALDVGLMNYVLEGTWTSYGFPLKMFEYFSLGKPVVSSDLPSIRKYEPLLRIVRRRDEWLRVLEEAVAAEGSDAAERRVQEAERNDWAVRSALVLRHIGEALKARGRASEAAVAEARP